MTKTPPINRNSRLHRKISLPIKTTRIITVKILITGGLTSISDFPIIIPHGGQIGHGITDAPIHRNGIHGSGDRYIILTTVITRTMAILRTMADTGDIPIIIHMADTVTTTLIIRTLMPLVIPVIREMVQADPVMVQIDLEMLDRPDQSARAAHMMEGAVAV